METSVDKFGRVVIPRKIRERLGLEPGTRVEIEVGEDGMRIRPLQDSPGLEVVDGRLVHTGKLREDFDLDRFIDRLRDDRAAELHGLKKR